MDNRKLGLLIVVISLIFSILILGLGNQLNNLQHDSCPYDDQCKDQGPQYLIYGSIAVIFSTLSLGVYLLFFDKSQKAIIDKLNGNSANLASNEKFRFILMGLSSDEKKIMASVKEQDGISQHTLGLRADMHKSKLSIVVSQLEEKGLIKKQKQGKINRIFLKIKLD